MAMACRSSTGCTTVARTAARLRPLDLRSSPFEVRKATLAQLLRKARPLALKDHVDLPADVIFRHACKLGFEGVVSKRLSSRYRSGRTHDWLNMKKLEPSTVGRDGRAAEIEREGR